LPGLLNHFTPAAFIEFLHIDDAHSGVVTEFPDVEIIQAAANTDLHRAFGIEQTLFYSSPERGTVMKF